MSLIPLMRLTAPCGDVAPPVIDETWRCLLRRPIAGCSEVDPAGSLAQSKAALTVSPIFLQGLLNKHPKVHSCSMGQYHCKALSEVRWHKSTKRGPRHEIPALFSK